MGMSTSCQWRSSGRCLTFGYCEFQNYKQQFAQGALVGMKCQFGFCRDFEGLPQQGCSVDCGVFVYCCAQALQRGHHMSFAQQQVQTVRHVLCKQLLLSGMLQTPITLAMPHSKGRKGLSGTARADLILQFVAQF